MYKRICTLISMLLIMSMVLAACAPKPTPTPTPKPAPTKAPEATPVPTATPAPKEVRVGVVYPLTGAGGEYGFKSRIAAELAQEIINYEHPELGDFPFAKTSGLPNLGGAKWRIIFADSQGKAEIGTAETERLITQEKVVAFSGMWYSSVTIAARVVTERYGIPLINDISSASKLNTEREQLGLKWYFSITPDDYDNSLAFFNILDDLRKKGEDIQTVAFIYTDDTRGMSMAADLKKIAQERGYKVVADLAYPAAAVDLSAEVLKLKAAQPDAVFGSMSPEQCINYLRVSKQLNFNPRILQGGVGWSSPLILKELGPDADYILSRESFSVDLASKRPVLQKINDMYRERSGGIDLDADCARAFQGQIVLATIINNAGSTDPEAIRQAALALNMPAEQLITPWDCVKFDPKTGKNICARSVIVQAQGGKWRLVWPWDLAPVDLIYPWPKWDER